MDDREKIFAELRKSNVRITKQRRAIIDVLEDKHLTIQEIYSELKNRGFNNLGTVYNNIDFLLENKIVTQIFINGKKHYDLTIDEKSHNADSHIHVTCKVNNNIIEINNSSIFDEIKANSIFRNFNISKLQLVVEGFCNHYEKDTCKKDGKCFIGTLGKVRN
ncbi:Ferric uptake regulation protein [Candidatus Izimaplasma bacterium HR1]|jgi:Fur family ferric uptake transcriptional regulator/Fur family peroxide stress response transcriptional regulator|uniref:Fur family transcriptional regulator n=1 Tax=Candidatus Izimoplasma sp. HR1 TaxID=1541959 RepID=UPI0004F67872|nr:Ferric uptake regulation protein [Candidatus Izimaplasma bacterium HR1]